MKFRLLLSSATTMALLFLLLMSAATAWADGPLSGLYLTAADQRMNWVVQGNSVLNSWTQACVPNCDQAGESAIALPGSIRTLGAEYPVAGSEYTFAGVPTGVKYPYPLQDPHFYDGTTDGSHNFSVDYIAGGVYMFDSNWANPKLLFNANFASLGITYDPANNSLWVANYTFRTIQDFSLDGFPLFYFQVPYDSLTMLAMDYADHTLWMGSQTTPGTFYQYSTDGQFLGQESYGDLATQNTLGGEFILPEFETPEPATLGLLGSGLLGIALWRRR
jgi:hypothetical protein